MPLGEKGGDSSSSLCGVETRFNPFMKDVYDHNITVGGFDFVVAPLMLPHYRPSNQVQCQFGSFALEPRLPYAKSDLSLSPSLWNAYVIGKISTWIDLDLDNQILRKDFEIVLQQEIAWASYLSLQACLLPAPKGTTWANYARCVNQILQSIKRMELWLRIPLGKPEDDSTPSFSTSVDYWKTWNSFRLLCDHDHKLLVALDNLGILPSNDSLSRWYGEPVAAFIIHTDSFFTSDHDDLKLLSEELQKLITDFLNHNIQIIISGEKAYTIASEEDIDDNFSAAGSQRHPLRPYLDYVISLYQQLDPLSEQEHLQFAHRDILQPTLQPLKNNLGNAVYENFEKDMNKYDEYERAICQALQDRVPDEKASMITTVLVVAGSGRGPLVRASLNASKETGRKLKVYAVEKNLSAVAYLNKCCVINGWEDIVTVVHSDVRSWNAPETADILVSALLGCFGDNELSPECLDGAQRFLKEDGISIPSSYTSFLQPVTASKIYNKVKAKNDILSFETAFVVNMHNVARLAPSQPVFTFTHPKPSDNESNLRYESLQFVIPDDAEPAMVHGFAGYFDATLYKDVHLAIEPSKATPGVFTWYAMFFPLRTPICVHPGSTLEVHFWRCCDSAKVWYEWCVTSPTLSIVHNSNGHAHWLEL